MNLVAIALFIMMVVTFIKFDLVCEVTANGEKLGYIKDKKSFEQSANDIMSDEVTTQYQLAFVAKTEEPNDEEVLAKLQKSIETQNKQKEIIKMGKVASAVDKNSKTTTTSSRKVTSRGSSISKTSKITTETKKVVSTTTTTDKKESEEETKKVSKETDTKKETKTASATENTTSKTKTTSLNGIQLTVKPVSGVITSRFGGRWGRQHTGLDIGAPKGTKIKAAASGTVIFSGYSGSYGNVVKISHGSGIQTYYAHCSKLYVKKGEKVSAGDVIAAVGSTGRSTGNHLHFEIRKKWYSDEPTKVCILKNYICNRSYLECLR